MDHENEKLTDIKTKLGYTVSCSNDTWENHITSGHPIMKDNEQAVIDALEQPCVVYESGEDENTDIFFGKSAHATYGEQLFTKCVVRTSSEKNWLATAFPCKEIGGNINEEALKYVELKF